MIDSSVSHARPKPMVRNLPTEHIEGIEFRPEFREILLDAQLDDHIYCFPQNECRYLYSFASCNTYARPPCRQITGVQEQVGCVPELRVMAK